MKHFLSKRWVKLSLVIGLLLATSAAGFASYTGLWSRRDFQIYQAMEKECDPVWRDFYWGRIQVGENVEDVIAKTRPTVVQRFGEFVNLSYYGDGEGIPFTGVHATAKGGRLVCAEAGSCTWTRVFFNQLSPAEQKGYWTARDAYVTSLAHYEEQRGQDCAPMLRE